MRKILLTITFIALQLACHSQSNKIEQENLTKRFNKGEITADEFKNLAKDWNALLTEVGGYPELPIDDNTISYVFTKKYDLEKKVIYNRILEWCAVNFGSLDAVLHYKDLESGKIIVKGYSSINILKDNKNFWGIPKESFSSVKSFQTYVFTIKDKALKVEVKNIEYENEYGGYLTSSGQISGSYKVKFSINDLLPITNFDKINWKENLSTLKQTGINISGFVYKIDEYINKYSEDYGF